MIYIHIKMANYNWVLNAQSTWIKSTILLHNWILFSITVFYVQYNATIQSLLAKYDRKFAQLRSSGITSFSASHKNKTKNWCGTTITKWSIRSKLQLHMNHKYDSGKGNIIDDISESRTGLTWNKTLLGQSWLPCNFDVGKRIVIKGKWLPLSE